MFKFMITKPNPARMRYKNDKKSAWLCYLSIMCCAAHFVGIYSNNFVVPDVRMGADIIINILFMLIVFWASEMVKTYKRAWSGVLAVLGAVQLYRVFWLPARYNELEQLVGGAYNYSRMTMALSGIFMILGALLSFSNSTLLKKYMTSLKH